MNHLRILVNYRFRGSRGRGGYRVEGGEGKAGRDMGVSDDRGEGAQLATPEKRICVIEESRSQASEQLCLGPFLLFLSLASSPLTSQHLAPSYFLFSSFQARTGFDLPKRVR